MTEAELFDYRQIECQDREFIKERERLIRETARRTAQGIVQIGQWLTEAKERLPHGAWLPWLESQFAWSDPSAERFMRVYRNFKSVNLTNMEIDVSALYLIAAPSTPEPVRMEALRRAENGEAVTHAGAQTLVQEYGAGGSIPPPEKSLAQMIAERRRARLSQQSPPLRPTASERKQEEQQRQARQEGSARVVALMTIVEALEAIAETEHSMKEVASFIDRFNTPDQDWPGDCREALSRITNLCKELGV